MAIGIVAAKITSSMSPSRHIFREDILRPKELTLIDLVHSEKAKGRKVWVYVQYTDKHDVQGRLSKLLIQAGLKVKVLQASLPLAQREDWIAKNAPDLDVVISHPKLVETGLDFSTKAEATTSRRSAFMRPATTYLPFDKLPGVRGVSGKSNPAGFFTFITKGRCKIGPWH